MLKVKWIPFALIFLLCVPSCSRPWTRDEILDAFSMNGSAKPNYPADGWYRVAVSDLMNFGEYDEFYGFSRSNEVQYVVGKIKGADLSFEKFVRKISEVRDGSLMETYQCFDGDMYATWTVSDGTISPIYGCRIAHPKFGFSRVSFIAPSADILRQLDFLVRRSDETSPYLYCFQGYYVPIDATYLWFNADLDYRFDQHLNLSYASLKATDTGALQPIQSPIGFWRSYHMEVYATDPIEISVPPFEERIVDVDTIRWSVA